MSYEKTILRRKMKSIIDCMMVTDRYDKGIALTFRKEMIINARKLLEPTTSKLVEELMLYIDQINYTGELHTCWSKVGESFERLTLMAYTDRELYRFFMDAAQVIE